MPKVHVRSAVATFYFLERDTEDQADAA
jgi:hypothetical protein